MATSSKVKLDPSHHPAFYLPTMSQEGADKASEILQENHEKFHCFYSNQGFHNHIVHHQLTIYALGATPQQLEAGYKRNAASKRPIGPLDEKIVAEMRDPAKFATYLGDAQHYHNWLVFFQSEIDAKGWQNVINEYCLARDARADDMLVRLFMGFLHPLIHLGFGVEFNQPAIIAEALAQAAVHSDWMGPFFFESEKAAAKRKASGEKPKSLVGLLEDIRADEKLKNSPHWDDPNKIRDGIMARAPENMLEVTAKFFLEGSSEAELERKTAEMINAAIYYTAGAQRPPKQVKFDFYFMHCVNCSIFFSTFLKQSWIKPQDKVRMLEWKARTDLAMYASRRAPEILIEEVEKYRPKIMARDGNEAWDNAFARVVRKDDDGHSAKFLRAIANGKNACRKFESNEEFRMRGHLWDSLGQMAIDSVEDDSVATWARSVGFDEAWVEFKDRPLAVL